MSVFGEFVVSWKCHNNRAQTERFKQQEFTPDSSGGFEVPDQGPVNSISGESSSGIVDGHLLSVSPHGGEREEGRELSSVSSYKDDNSIKAGRHSYYLI